MTIISSAISTATGYLVQRLNTVAVDTASDANNTTNYSNDISIDTDASYALMIKDSIENNAYLYSAIQVTANQLQTIADKLQPLRDIAIQLSETLANTAEYIALVDQKLALERDLSQYIGEQFHRNEMDILHQTGFINGSSDDAFMDIIGFSDTDGNVTASLSAIEVDFSTITSALHDPATCPHCAAQNDMSINGELPANEYEQTYPTPTTNVTGSASVDAAGNDVDTLLMGVKWDLEEGEKLSYSFYDGTVPYDPNYNGSDVSTATDGDPKPVSMYGSGNEALLKTAIELWDNVVEFAFEEVSETASKVGEIRIAYTTAGVQYGRAAFAYGPYGSSASGDVWFEIADTEIPGDNDFDTGGIGDGGSNFYAALHELGHAIGLSHPFDSSSASGSTLSTSDDTQRYSVMSYTRDDRNKVLDYGSNGASTSYDIYASTPMILDIMAMDQIYGLDTEYNNGDNVYDFALDPKILMTIYDTGGIDTIDGSLQTRDSIIDLNAGNYSSIGIYTEVEQVTDLVAKVEGYGFSGASIQTYVDALNSNSSTNERLYTGEDNVGIANGVEIENAIGGSGNDQLIGNNLANRFTGNAGDDTINGGSGDDIAVFNGAESDYTITDNGGVLTVVDNNGTDGTDTLTSIEYIQFKANATTSAKVQSPTDITPANLDFSSSAGTFDISVDGGAAVSISLSDNFTGVGVTDQDKLDAFASALETAINQALSDAGQTGRVNVSINSPLTITSQTTGSSSSLELSNFSASMQTALVVDASGSQLAIDQGATIGDAVYWDVSTGNSTTVQPATVAGESNDTNAGAGIGGGAGGGSGSGSSSSGSARPVVEGTISAISVLTRGDAEKAIYIIDAALSKITSSQAMLGAVMNRLDYAIDSMSNAALNTRSAQSRIQDADISVETAKLMKARILQKSAMSIINRSHLNAQGVTRLLS